MGIVGKRTGSVKLEGVETISLPSYQIARRGIAICPEERGIFASLDVYENLLLPPRVQAGRPPPAPIFEPFPTLTDGLAHPGAALSPREQHVPAHRRRPL